jgi:hypothetical protein
MKSWSFHQNREASDRNNFLVVAMGRGNTLTFATT